MALKKLSAADLDALNRMPDGWFSPYQLPCMVKRPEYRCTRLKELGALEYRYVSTAPWMDKDKYRKVKG